MATITNRLAQRRTVEPLAPELPWMNGGDPVVRHKRVLITSLECGGGHRALLNTLAETMPGAPHTRIYTYHSRRKIYDTVYRYLLRFPWLYQKLRENTYILMKYLGWVQVLFDYQDSKKIVQDVQPDLVVCANPLQPIIFLQVKRALKLNYDVVMCICDYGEQKAYVDSAPTLQHYLVRDEYTRQCTEQYVSPDLISTFGTTVHRDFTAVRQMDLPALRAAFREFRDQLAPGLELNDGRPKILVIGGSGWVKNSLGLITRMSELGDYDILVACGKDKKLAKTLAKMTNVFPFGFVEQRRLAVVERSVDAIILSSLAPATMHEIFTVNQHPLFVHRYIKGQESPHIDLLARWDVGVYEPDDEQMISLVKDYLASREKYLGMVENAYRIQQDNVVRARNNPRLLADLCHTTSEAADLVMEPF